MTRPAVPRLATLAGLVLATPVCLAQVAPDAGQTIREQGRSRTAPEAAPGIAVEPREAPAVERGGPKLTLREVELHGNTRFSDEALRAVLGEVAGRELDFAGLRALTEKIDAHYRAAGLPFARAFLPPQDLGGGTLRIEILEGRYGRVVAEGDAALGGGANRFLAPLAEGDVIASRPLERATLLLEDQPGVTTSPLIRPGEAVGTGDLVVGVAQTERFGGRIEADNQGNRFTGRARAGLNLFANRVLAFGDRVEADLLYTEEDLAFGSLAYAVPIGGSGLRARAGYAHTFYELGEEFEALDASGTAQVASLGLSYPIIRSQARNLSVSAIYRHKVLDDEQEAADVEADKSSDTLTLAFDFDLRDGLGGGGVTYGRFAWTHGVLDLDSRSSGVDRATARTEGSFDRLNLELVRLQALPGAFQLYGRFAAQWAGSNLDSSEGFGLGGPNGVRAFPVGEGFGDEGVLGQLELRYRMEEFTPFALVDAGRVSINAEPWTPGGNQRNVSGAGLGLRFDRGGWNAEGVLAWGTSGGDPRSDGKDPTPRAWVSLSYRF